MQSKGNEPEVKRKNLMRYQLRGRWRQIGTWDLAKFCSEPIHFFHLQIEDVFLALLYRGIPKEKKTTKRKGLRIQEIILYI